MSDKDSRWRQLYMGLSRQDAIDRCRKVRDTLDGYVRSRHGCNDLFPVVKIRWFRIALAILFVSGLLIILKKGLQ